MNIFTLGSDLSTSHITCGSAIKLRHVDSSKYYLSSKGFNWSTQQGSGQQVVTLSKDKSSSSLYWQIQEAFNQTACETGKPIQCGDTIRLLHLETKKRLHSHHVKSSLSHQQEISAFGDTGEYGIEGGDSSDNWKVVCRDKYWYHAKDVRLRHVATGSYLRSSTQTKFTETNCPRCPIINELEVVGSNAANHLTNFQSTQGIRLYK